jgi:hypothetical protein
MAGGHKARSKDSSADKLVHDDVFKAKAVSGLSGFRNAANCHC